MLEILLSWMWELLRSQKFGVPVELASRAWNPVLRSYCSSMETLLVLFFYKTVGVIVPMQKWRHESNAFHRDLQICFSVG